MVLVKAPGYDRITLTSRVVAGSQEDASSCLSNSNDIAGSRCAEDAILTDQELLDAVCCADLGDQLCDLWIPVPSVTANDEKGALSTFRYGEDNTGNKSLAVVFLLEDLDLLT